MGMPVRAPTMPQGTVWDIKRSRMPKLMTIIGYTYKEAYAHDWRDVETRRPETSHISRNFWSKHEDDLHEVGYDLHQRYRQKMRLVHPDVSHRTEEAVKVNLAWAKIKRLFENRGITL